MRWIAVVSLVVFASTLHRVEADDHFPAQLVRFVPYKKNPVFTARGEGHWDVKIRERGWILHEPDGYRMWYTGYDGTRKGVKLLGYATSRDGLQWQRAPAPLTRDNWVEDMMVLKHDGIYYMAAEGRHDIAHLLTSKDGIHWQRRGAFDVRLKDGRPIPKGPFGTPTLYFEKGTWHLFYERGDQGVWLATSPDGKVYTNVQDEPVLTRGPAAYDRFAVALNQIVKYEGRYYAYYHAADTPEWRRWSTNIATSADLVHWTKYPNNPILENNKSSGILVPDGPRFRLYTMHGTVDVYFPEPHSKATP